MSTLSAQQRAVVRHAVEHARRRGLQLVPQPAVKQTPRKKKEPLLTRCAYCGSLTPLVLACFAHDDLPAIDLYYLA